MTRRTSGLLPLVLLFVSGSAMAASVFVATATGDWDNPAVWSFAGGDTDADGIPDADDTIYTGNAAWQGYSYTRYKVTLHDDVEVATANLAWDRPAGFDLNGYTLHVTGAVGTSYGGDLTVDRTGGGNLDFDNGVTCYQSLNIPVESGDAVDGNVSLQNAGAGLTLNSGASLTRTGWITMSGTGADLTLEGASLTQDQYIRFQYANTGVISGHGTIDLQGSYLDYYSAAGNVIADGGTLEFVNAGLAFSNPNDEGGHAGKGWFAQNGGELKLPPITVASGSSTEYWGRAAADSGAADTRLVNSIALNFVGVGGGDVQISLLDSMSPVIAAEMAYVASGDVASIWNFDTSSGFSFGDGSVELVIRYHESMVGDENTLQLWHFLDGSGWAQAPISVDTTDNVVTASGLTSFSPFLLGNNIVVIPIPEPSSIVLLFFGAAALHRRRRRHTA